MRRLTRARSCHGPALARQPSCLVNTLAWAASRRLQFATRCTAAHWRQPSCRVGFGTWALAVLLRLKPLARPTDAERTTNTVRADLARCASGTCRCFAHIVCAPPVRRLG
jgi:hypothetical protein